MLEFAEQNYISAEAVADAYQASMVDPQLRQAIIFKNALCAYVFLITWFLQDYFKLKETKEAALSKGKRKVKKDKTDDQAKLEQEQNSILMSAQNIIKLMHQAVLEQPVHLLWPDRQVDEEFVKTYLKTGFDMLTAI